MRTTLYLLTILLTCKVVLNGSPVQYSFTGTTVSTSTFPSQNIAFHFTYPELIVASVTASIHLERSDFEGCPTCIELFIGAVETPFSDPSDQLTVRIRSLSADPSASVGWYFARGAFSSLGINTTITPQGPLFNQGTLEVTRVPEPSVGWSAFLLIGIGVMIKRYGSTTIPQRSSAAR